MNIIWEQFDNSKLLPSYLYFQFIAWVFTVMKTICFQCSLADIKGFNQCKNGRREDIKKSEYF